MEESGNATATQGQKKREGDRGGLQRPAARRPWEEGAYVVLTFPTKEEKYHSKIGTVMSAC